MELEAQTFAAVVTNPEGFRRQLYKDSALVCSPLKHTCALFLSALMQTVKCLLERGWPQKGPDTKAVDVTCCRRDVMLSVSECPVSRASTLYYKHLASCLFEIFHSSSFSSSHLFTISSKSRCVSLTSDLQGDILTVIRRVNEHWIEAKFGEKVGICPLQYIEVSLS